jgi:CRP/FNR family cyclic AMP-dependent transcriptional regulator
MDDPILTIDEREAINSGRWFSSLSPIATARHPPMRLCQTLQGRRPDRRPRRPARTLDRLRQGCGAREFDAVSGKQVTLTYVEPGIWFGDVAMFDGDRRTHDTYSHGDSTILCVARADFQKIPGVARGVVRGADAAAGAAHPHSCSGWWKTSTPCPCGHGWPSSSSHLVRSYGVPNLDDGSQMRIGLQLAQEELAQLLGASRQRVNQELKTMEREGTMPHRAGRPRGAGPRGADARLGS